MQACTVGKPLQWELCTVLVVHAARASMGPTHLACRWVGFEVALRIPERRFVAAQLPGCCSVGTNLHFGLGGRKSGGHAVFLPRPGRLLASCAHCTYPRVMYCQEANIRCRKRPLA